MDTLIYINFCFAIFLPMQMSIFWFAANTTAHLSYWKQVMLMLSIPSQPLFAAWKKIHETIIKRIETRNELDALHWKWI